MRVVADVVNLRARARAKSHAMLRWGACFRPCGFTEGVFGCIGLNGDHPRSGRVSGFRRGHPRSDAREWARNVEKFRQFCDGAELFSSGGGWVLGLVGGDGVSKIRGGEGDAIDVGEGWRGGVGGEEVELFEDAGKVGGCHHRVASVMLHGGSYVPAVNAMGCPGGAGGGGFVRDNSGAGWREWSGVEVEGAEKDVLG